MALAEGMFLFEVVVESVKSLIECKLLVIKADFADIFSLELKDPKQLNIVMPEPPPLPPEPPGKKKGKKAKPKKPKKGKKGKGVVEEAPKEPLIQSGQSVLFACSAEYLIQCMKKSPIQISLWDKDQKLRYIGSNVIPWDEIYLEYLNKILNCESPQSVFVKDEYNMFEEGTAKLVAKLGIQIKLTFLKDKIVTAFRTLSEDPNIRKYLYTGINSKTTSYMCTMKTDDTIFIENSKKFENKFVEDNPNKPIQYADYKNAASANLAYYDEQDYCCLRKADKLPTSKYKSPETVPNIDEISDYIRSIIVSCNDNMRMLTPRTILRPRVKATDIDRLCYCQETHWPKSELAERMKDEVQHDQCPVCINKYKKRKGARSATIDIANIRGLCGKADCKIARDLRSYILQLVEEDNKEVDINAIIGPCGSKSCTLAEKVQEFLRHEGVFKHTPETLEGLSTQCGCVKTMREALARKVKSCQSICSKDCSNFSEDDDEEPCGGPACPTTKRNYEVYYCSVEYDKDNKTPPKSPQSTLSGSNMSQKYKYCDSECSSLLANKAAIVCSKSTCCTRSITKKEDTKCHDIKCPHFGENSPSPDDSNIIMNIDDIHNQCCVETCDVAEKVKNFIIDNWEYRQKRIKSEDPCYCDCECNLNFTHKTTYCDICEGYKVKGDDMDDQPPYARPHPCPVYHNLYDKKKIVVPSPWQDNNNEKAISDTNSHKSKKSENPQSETIDNPKEQTEEKEQDKKSKKPAEKVEKQKKPKAKKQYKVTSNVVVTPKVKVEKVTRVPKNMGWLWTATDVPGMKSRPNWKPGASLKGLVKRYLAMRGSVDIMAKKKRAMLQKRKKLEMKPTLIVRKVNGEYEVQMEVLKTFSKERLLFQYPYDEKPPLIYTVGKTEEEQQKIKAKRERRERREIRRKCKILQSTFRNRCQEICLKAYNQAIGVLPRPNPNYPNCPCDVDSGKNIESPQIDSCSCSDEDISSSDTDGDDWIIEFTPPAARWDVKAKHQVTTLENETQYNYLDFKVKLVDKSGNPIPRYFKGPDGKQECSDLGGFWGPGHVWLEINRDGYIGVDNRWVPLNFIGPDGMYYSAEEGSFTDANGQVLKIGIDGYVDKDNKWAWYPGGKKTTKDNTRKNSLSNAVVASGKFGKDKGKHDDNSKNAKDTSKGKDVTKATKHNGRKDTNVSKIKQTNSPYSKSKQILSVTSISYNSPRRSLCLNKKHKFENESRLDHYREIMDDGSNYKCFPLGPPRPVVLKTSRACNTKKVSLFTMV